MAHTTISLRFNAPLDDREATRLVEELEAFCGGRAQASYETVAPKFTYKIRHDDDCDSPREWNNVGVLACKHRSYSIGDKDHELPFVDGDWRAGVLREDVYLCWDVYGYEHGGIALSHARSGQFADTFDSGRAGWHYVTFDAVKENWPELWRVHHLDLGSTKLRDKVERCLKAELEAMNLWLSGSCWRYSITDEEGNVVDSCGGFITDDVEDMIGSAGSEHAEGLRAAWSDRE